MAFLNKEYQSLQQDSAQIENSMFSSSVDSPRSHVRSSSENNLIPTFCIISFWILIVVILMITVLLIIYQVRKRRRERTQIREYIRKSSQDLAQSMDQRLETSAGGYATRANQQDDMQYELPLVVLQSKLPPQMSQSNQYISPAARISQSPTSAQLNQRLLQSEISIQDQPNPQEF
eukprot:403343664